MAHTKRRVKQHIMEEQSYLLLRGVLPEEWAVHEYRPDYGIDLVVEVFKYIDPHRTTADTLGELFFVQAKSIQRSKMKTIRVLQRENVEKTGTFLRKGDSQLIQVFPFSIDTDELLTIQRMGPTVPVLLFLICMDIKRVFFVCLSDLLDKVVLVDDPQYATKKKKTLYVPVKNEVQNTFEALVPLRFYAKRPKFYAAFNRFAYQETELQYMLHLGKPGIRTYRQKVEHPHPETQLRSMLARFVVILQGLDIWDDTEMWLIVSDYKKKIAIFKDMLENPNISIIHISNTALLLWNGLTTLSRNYEELCREWFLPTFLAQILSYPE